MATTAAPSYHPPLPKLPMDLYHWPSWRQSNDEPLTPPPSALEQAQYNRPPFVHSVAAPSSSSSTSATTTVLPPISHLDRFARPPTPPYEDAHPSRPHRTSPPPVQSRVSCDTGLSSDYHDYMMGAPEPAQSLPSPAPAPAPYAHPIDWFGTGHHKHSSQLLAEKTCEMICYMWFAPALPATATAGAVSSAASPLQLAAPSGFVQFMQKVLETTQVSQAVIVLALHYIYVLKERNRTAHGQPGSEFRVSIAGLMLANKFLDDNTYTNKTWSEVSGIELADINRMEREFLRGLGFTLYVDKARYEAWLKLLKGFVLAKERALQLWHHHHAHRARRAPRAHASHSRPPRALPSPPREPPAPAPRARSTSPCRRPVLPRLAMPVPEHAGAKRSAASALSPAPRPAKRPLEIPTARVSPAPSVSPLAPLSSFARLSLAGDSPAQPLAPPPPPQALVAAYRADPERTLAVPQNLYYYSLACSPNAQPADAVVDAADRESWRRARLRTHVPPPAPAPLPVYAPLPRPHVVQSAQSSPHASAPAPAPPAFPAAGDAVWRAPLPAYGAGYAFPPHAGYAAQSARTSPVAYAYADWARGRAC